MLNLPLCHWSSQLFDLLAPSSTDVPVLLLKLPIFWFTSFTSLHVRESEFRNPENFCWWNPKSGTLGFGMRNINKAHGIQNPSSTGKDWNPVPGIRNPAWSPESRPSDKGRGPGWSPKKIFFWSKNKGWPGPPGPSPGSATVGFPYMGRFVGKYRRILLMNAFIT